MKFVGMESLKPGMRLARPIYNKKGVLLFERDSKLTAQNIESVKSFGLLGMYILEPAEPLTPMSEDDMEYERFQIATGFMIQDELDKILSGKKQNGIANLASMIIKKFGYLDNKINFYQNLRSLDDYVCRHSLNVTILCAMMTHKLNVRLEEQMQTVMAALVHDIGVLQAQKQRRFGTNNQRIEEQDFYEQQLAAMELLDVSFIDSIALKRICSQAIRAQHDIDKNGEIGLNGKMVFGANVLLVANRFDELTAVNLQGKAESEVKAIQEFLAHPKLYNPQIVDALIRSVNILIPGVSVVLNTGEKALVIAENPQDVLRPTVLTFNDNNTLNLALTDNQFITIEDVMKTMDNRYVMIQKPGAD